MRVVRQKLISTCLITVRILSETAIYLISVIPCTGIRKFNTLKDGKTESIFYSSDESDEYTITVEGITPEGKRGYSTAELVVK